MDQTSALLSECLAADRLRRARLVSCRCRLGDHDVVGHGEQRFGASGQSAGADRLERQAHQLVRAGLSRGRAKWAWFRLRSKGFGAIRAARGESLVPDASAIATA